MKVDGKKIKNMEEELTNGQMEINMKEIGKKINNMVKDSSCGPLEFNMLVILRRT